MVKRHHGLVPLTYVQLSHIVYGIRLREGKPDKIKSNRPNNTEEQLLIDHTKEYFKTDMLRHFDLEEKEVFPIYDLYVDQHSKEKELLEYIKMHHQLVKQKIDSLDTLKGKELRDKLNEIGIDIEEHIRKEERKLFEDIQKRIPNDELIEIGKILKEKSVLKFSNFL